MTSTPREFRAWKAVNCLADAHRGKEKVRKPFHISPYSPAAQNVKLTAYIAERSWLDALRRFQPIPAARGPPSQDGRAIYYP
jgi:hypothetical protein